MKALFIIPQIGFNETELFTIKKFLEKNRIKCVIASYAKGKAIGKNGKTVKASESICNLYASDYDCFIFVGGENVSSLAEHKCVLSLLNQANSKGKLIALLCMNPAIFIPVLDFLKNKRMTVFRSKNKWSENIIKDKAIYVNELVVVDSNILTCRDEKDSQLLAEKIAELLNK